jgi:hypothetical protein
MAPPLTTYQRPEMSSSSTSLLIKPALIKPPLKPGPPFRGLSPVSFFIPPSPRQRCVHVIPFSKAPSIADKVIPPLSIPLHSQC